MGRYALLNEDAGLEAETGHDMIREMGKAEQIRNTGAQWVVTARENCKSQLSDLNEYHELGVKVKGVVQLVTDSLELENTQPERNDEGQEPALEPTLV